MEKLLKYKKQLIIIVSLIMLSVILFGVYLLQTTLDNINYSKSEAHVIALNQFSGTITSSEIEYEDLKVFYEIKILSKAAETINITISAETGKIIGFEYEQGES